MEKRALLDNAASFELVEPQRGVKMAGTLPVVQAFLDSLQPEPAYTYALANAMGCSEFYGANSNADYYGHNPHVGMNGLLHAWEDIGQDHAADRVRAKNWPYGYPTFYNAAIYAHHKNTCPNTLGFGDVLFSYANPVMRRIELLLRVNNEEAHKKGHSAVLERLFSGARCDVSMGARVPYDTCSVCTDWAAYKEALATFNASRHAHPGIAVLAWHRTVRPIRGLAVTPADYCRCMRESRNRTLPSGQRVFVYNDYPRFFDLSFVFIGADKTARAVAVHRRQPEKRAGAALAPVIAQAAAFAGTKTAMQTKEVQGVVAAVLQDADTAAPVDFAALLSSRTRPSARGVLATAAALGIVLSPGEYQALLAPRLPGAFSTETSGIDDAGGITAADVSVDLMPAIRCLCGQRSGYAPFLAPRLAEPVHAKVAASAPLVGTTRDHQKLAMMYNGYRLSMLEQAPALAAGAGCLVPDPFFQDSAPRALAGLLLGLAPVIHLLATHLQRRNNEDRRLGVAVLAVPENPTFGDLATLGAGIRSALLAESGGILAAATRFLACTPAG